MARPAAKHVVVAVMISSELLHISAKVVSWFRSTHDEARWSRRHLSNSALRGRNLVKASGSDSNFFFKSAVSIAERRANNGSDSCPS